MSKEKCPNCGRNIAGFFANAVPVSELQTECLNKYIKSDTTSYCNKCYEEKMIEVAAELDIKKKRIK